MKTILLLALLAFNAAAQDMRDPQRVVNSRRANLQPLFTWWTNAETICASNKHLSIKKKIPLPERIMPAWVRIITTDITNSGQYWTAGVKIQHSPVKSGTNMLILIRNGPIAAKKQYDQDAAEFESVSASRRGASSASSSESSRASRLASRGSLYQEINNASPSRGIKSLSQDYWNASSQARANSENAAQREAYLATRQDQLRKKMKDGPRMKLDGFALCTGETYGGLPVYDMGLAGR